MKKYSLVLVTFAVVVGIMYSLSNQKTESVTGDYFFAITSAGVLNGYSVVDTSLTFENGKQILLLEQRAYSQGKLLGREFDSNVELVYHIDPQSGQFIFCEFEVDNGQGIYSAQIKIEDEKAHCESSFGVKNQVVDLPVDVLLENPLFHKNILKDFSQTDLKEKVYSAFDTTDQKIQDVKFSFAGHEEIELAGREYSTIKVDRENLETGVIIRLWLDSESGICVKILENEGRVIYLADSSLAKEVERFDSDPYILTKTNVSIADICGISYMKVRAKLKPTGVLATPESLNVQGQKFSGTVENNLIEGIFEIEHSHYNGQNAPPFPPIYNNDPDLVGYLQPSEMTESDYPPIVAKAEELTLGSADSWEAACRLSKWVSTEIVYSIPGGGTAKGVFEAMAGECGGHSVLLAAMCRAVGIPARMVWGVTYVPNKGGMFGQHGWNEIFMGEAGWIPVDSTGPEITFVDSGHIRLGTFDSFATYANGKEFEIIDFRLAGDTEESSAAATVKYEAFLGEYSSPGKGKPAKVFTEGGSLVFDLPDNIALALNDPDEKGHWYSKLARHIYLTFDQDDSGKVVEAQIHEVYRLPKKPGPAAWSEEVPEQYRAYVGNYSLLEANVEFVISTNGRGLQMYHPLTKTTSSLRSPNDEGGWVADNNRHTIFFERDDDGLVCAMTIDGVSRYKR
ncbi:MAG: transglutaminase domain-containing protein [bacterium]|nr:transglutaminase domain-containing protein [bacterium]